ncbi:hypothetical protein PHOSAC3_150212 [Mesotoga infera]|nr:hypothetical protein PHOSAC3_150212 [Mesotoga infera]
MKRTGNQFRVSMQLRKLSGRFVKASHSVIPDLIRDLAFDLIQRTGLILHPLPLLF